MDSDLQFAQLEQQYQLPHGILAAVQQQESGGDPDAVSPKGAVGAFQFMPATAQQYGIDPKDPNQAAEGAARLLGDLYKKYKGNLPATLAAYNWGQGNVDRKGLKSAPTETANYVNSVQDKMAPGDGWEPVSQGSAGQWEPVKQASNDDWEPVDFKETLKSNIKRPDTFDTVSDQALQGATFGFGDEAQAALAGAVQSGINGKSFGENYKDAKGIASQRLTQEQQDSPVTSTVANLAGGIGAGVAGTGTEAGAAAANWLGGGNLAARIAKGVLAGAASGGLYGAGTAEDGGRLEGAKEGAELGGVVGGAIPAVSAAAGAVKNAVFPAVSKDVQPLAKKALDYGIPLARSQVGDSKFAKTLASTAGEIPLSGSQQFYQKQASAFNRAIASTFGEDADKITPEVIDAAYENIGKKYDTALAGKTIPLSEDALNVLGSIESDAASYLTADHAEIVQNTIDKILTDVTDKGTIAGEKLGSLRSAITSALKTTRNDSSPYLSRIRDAIVDMSGDSGAILKEANAQYRALKTIEPLAIKATESGGNISPALLQARVAQSFRDYSRGGGGKLGDLARIGQKFIKETIPNSGTARRLAAYGALFEGPAAIGALATGNPAVAAAGLAPMATARAFNAVNTSQPLVRKALDAAPSLPLSTLGMLPGNISQQMSRAKP